jgi:hypothetical protein
MTGKYWITWWFAKTVTRLPMVPLVACSVYGTCAPVPSGYGAEAGRGGRVEAVLPLLALTFPSIPPRPPKLPLKSPREPRPKPRVLGPPVKRSVHVSIRTFFGNILAVQESPRSRPGERDRRRSWSLLSRRFLSS